jgi:tRNA-Thr(GGU) m(6)t(6)A37 methyltransferase TsaA
MPDILHLNPIGFVESELKERYETPQQGVLSENIISCIKLNPNNNFEQALKDLEGFERIWVIYLFHLNDTWNPLVLPPRFVKKKIGVFASRSPHRPNNIGLSCVKLEKISGLDVYISGSDILDRSPVLDIKPYLPYADSFPFAETGWVKTGLKPKYEVRFSEIAFQICEKIKQMNNENIEGYAKVQLQFDPGDTSRKRISRSNTDGLFILEYKDWKICYSFKDSDMSVMVLTVLLDLDDPIPFSLKNKWHT